MAVCYILREIHILNFNTYNMITIYIEAFKWLSKMLNRVFSAHSDSKFKVSYNLQN